MLGGTILLPNILTPVLNGMRKGTRMQPILRDGQLLVKGDRLRHTAGFYEIIRQSNPCWTDPQGRGRECAAEGEVDG